MQGICYEYFEPTNAARLEEAGANAREALRLDANLAEAHMALAVYARLTHDLNTTKGEIATALRLNPNDASLAMTAAIN